MEKLYSPRIIKELLDKYGFRLSKSLGQNFLIDGNIVNRIIEGAEIKEDDLIVEVGPGIGVLTFAAAKKAAMVVGIEIDRNLLPILKETLSDCENVKILHKDIMKTDLAAIVKEEQQLKSGKIRHAKLIANLPYYITTPIIMKVLEDKSGNAPIFESLTVMLQKEVADRIRANPGTKAYGALSVAVGYYCIVEEIATVPKEVFLPRPKVDSTVLRLVVREKPPVEVQDENALFSVIKAGFGQRRKTLGNSITGIYGLNKEQAGRALEKAGISPVRRAETLNLQEFAWLADAVFAIAEQEQDDIVKDQNKNER